MKQGIKPIILTIIILVIIGILALLFWPTCRTESGEWGRWTGSMVKNNGPVCCRIGWRCN